MKTTHEVKGQAVSGPPPFHSSPAIREWMATCCYGLGARRRFYLCGGGEAGGLPVLAAGAFLPVLAAGAAILVDAVGAAGAAAGAEADGVDS